MYVWRMIYTQSDTSKRDKNALFVSELAAERHMTHVLLSSSLTSPERRPQRRRATSRQVSGGFSLRTTQFVGGTGVAPDSQCNKCEQMQLLKRGKAVVLVREGKDPSLFFFSHGTVGIFIFVLLLVC